MLFSLYKQDYNKKEGTPSWQEPVPSFIKYIPKEVSKYYDTHFRSVLQAEKIKISDQAWFDQAVGDLMLSDQCCPYCGAKSNMKPHDSYSRYMVTLKGDKPVTESLCVPRVKCTSCGHTHALLPEMLIPYSSYSLRFVLSVLNGVSI